MSLFWSFESKWTVNPFYFAGRPLFRIVRFRGPPLTWSVKLFFRDDLNENICVCPDSMQATCAEEKESFAMEKEQMLHLIYGCGFVVFFIVLISKFLSICQISSTVTQIRLVNLKLLFGFGKNFRIGPQKVSLGGRVRWMTTVNRLVINSPTKSHKLSRRNR